MRFLCILLSSFWRSRHVYHPSLTGPSLFLSREEARSICSLQTSSPAQTRTSTQKLGSVSLEFKHCLTDNAYVSTCGALHSAFARLARGRQSPLGNCRNNAGGLSTGHPRLDQVPMLTRGHSSQERSCAHAILNDCLTFSSSCLYVNLDPYLSSGISQ